MNTKLLGTAGLVPSVMLFGSMLTGCGILETVQVPEFRFDSNSYVVQPGDTLESVASRYRIDPDSLMSVNSLQLATLVPGQRLLLLRDEGSAGSMLNKSSLQGRSVAGAAGQPVMIPNTVQTAGAPATVRPVMQSESIRTDLVIVPTSSEEVVKVVDASRQQQLDDLLDDNSPLITRDIPVTDPLIPLSTDSLAGGVDRPEGVETIIKSVEAGQTVAMTAPGVPTAGSINILDSDVDAPSKRITVNRHEDGWNWPAIGTITKEFDLREINRQGLDIDPGPGAGVQAAADGEVVYSGRDLASYGNLVILRHDGNFLSAYSKVSDIFVEENQKVKAGDLIASVGSKATEDTELHFEIRRNGEPVNPIDYLPAL